jgi:hypothetical protein
MVRISDTRSNLQAYNNVNHGHGKERRSRPGDITETNSDQPKEIIKQAKVIVKPIPAMFYFTATQKSTNVIFPSQLSNPTRNDSHGHFTHPSQTHI